METNIQFADRVLTTLRLTSKDRFISRRFILKVGREKTKFLLSQKLRDRSLYREENIYTDIPCVEMEKIDVISCPIVEFRTCKKLMRSKKRLPDLIYSRYGDSIRMVSNIDYSIIINRTNPVDYIRNKKRAGYREKPLYYVRDGYLYITDSNIETVSVQVLTLDKKTASEVECGCGDHSECDTPLDYEFIGSDKLREVAYQETLKELVGTYMQIMPDENPNLNQKSI